MSGVTPEKSDYIKCSLLSITISVFLVYISNIKVNIGEEVLKGQAPF
jgi:hypothetical protein